MSKVYSPVLLSLVDIGRLNITFVNHKPAKVSLIMETNLPWLLLHQMLVEVESKKDDIWCNHVKLLRCPETARSSVWLVEYANFATASIACS